MQQMLRERMQAAGLEYGERSMTYNSRLAQELGKWSDTQVGGAAIHRALFRAYFVEGRNLSDLDVLVDTAEGIGLDARAARQVLEQRTFSPLVERDWHTARELGITGVPTFVAEDQALVGCQPYEILEKFILHAQQLADGRSI